MASSVTVMVSEGADGSWFKIFKQIFSVDPIEDLEADEQTSFIDVKIPLQCLVRESAIIVHTTVKVWTEPRSHSAKLITQFHIAV